MNERSPRNPFEKPLDQAIEQIKAQTIPHKAMRRALLRARRISRTSDGWSGLPQRLILIGSAVAAVLICGVLTSHWSMYLKNQNASGSIAKKSNNTAVVCLDEVVQGMPANTFVGVPLATGHVIGMESSWPPITGHNTEAYDHFEENRFQSAKHHPLSTFAVDVDTASYANIRRFLNYGTLPPRGAVRIEEMINYFAYDYPQPQDGRPFSVHIDSAECPWRPEHRLVRIGLKGKELSFAQKPPANLVFLIDVSGSMKAPNKLPLLKRSLELLTQQLGEDDRVAIVVYAGASGVILPSTPGTQKSRILAAISQLEASGSTNGGQGIQSAYAIAEQHFIKGGVNRVLLATDGDFNVGITSHSELVQLIEEKARTGVFLSVLGFGTGNLKDSLLEKLADKGNGNYSYIDTIREGQKVLVQQASGTLVTIAKDVKIQVEFNPAKVTAYRLIGYENRLLENEDFRDDKKDAGEIGAGHTVTALYEVVPAGVKIDLPEPEKLKYQKPANPENKPSDEWLTVKVRYKLPDEKQSQLFEKAFIDEGARWQDASDDFRFAAMVASFGMLLRDSKYKGNATFASISEMAANALGRDPFGYRAEFLKLVERASHLKRN
ncbi:MAG: hypothetical protein KatS3mg105_2373 [Gemmatales bacterium]|nr:MAG: hypothetical protein KatS3mg105_2373 [Gemmatales bacterium]